MNQCENCGERVSFDELILGLCPECLEEAGYSQIPDVDTFSDADPGL